MPILSTYRISIDSVILPSENKYISKAKLTAAITTKSADNPYETTILQRSDIRLQQRSYLVIFASDMKSYTVSDRLKVRSPIAAI